MDLKVVDEGPIMINSTGSLLFKLQNHANYKHNVSATPLLNARTSQHFDLLDLPAEFRAVIMILRSSFESANFGIRERSQYIYPRIFSSFLEWRFHSPFEYGYVNIRRQRQLFSSMGCRTPTGLMRNIRAPIKYREKFNVMMLSANISSKLLFQSSGCPLGNSRRSWSHWVGSDKLFLCSQLRSSCLLRDFSYKFINIIDTRNKEEE